MTCDTQANRSRLSTWAPLLIVVLIGTAGCSRKGDIYGIVTQDGKPVVYGTVSIIGADGIQRNGQIHSDGYYEIFDIPTGPAKLTVFSPDPEAQHKELVGSQKDPETASLIAPPDVDRSKWFPISSSYSDPETSGIAHDLKSGHNELNITLNRSAETPEPSAGNLKGGDKGPKDKTKDKTKGRVPLTPVGPRASGGSEEPAKP